MPSPTRRLADDDETTADASEKACLDAFHALLAAPCGTMADVAAKADYILNGTVGRRQTLLSDLIGPGGEDPTDPAGPLVSFLRSLAPRPPASGVPLVHGAFAGALAMIAPSALR